MAASKQRHAVGGHTQGIDIDGGISGEGGREREVERKTHHIDAQNERLKEREKERKKERKRKGENEE